MAQRLKCLPAMWETRVRSLGWEDPWRRKWQPTPVFLPGESHGRRSLVGYSPQGRKKSDTTERLHFHFHFHYAISIPQRDETTHLQCYKAEQRLKEERSREIIFPKPLSEL